MPADIFDQVAEPKADIFDRVATPKTDIFDQVAQTSGTGNTPPESAVTASAGEQVTPQEISEADSIEAQRLRGHKQIEEGMRESALATRQANLAGFAEGVARSVDVFGALNWVGRVVGGFTQDLIQGRVLPTPERGAIPDLPATGAALAGVKESLPERTIMTPVQQGIIEGAKGLPTIIAAGALVSAGVPPPAAFAAAMGGTSLSETGDPVEAAKSAAVGAVLPGIGSAAKELGARVMAGAVRKGLVDAGNVTAQKSVEAAAELAGIVAFNEVSHLPNYAAMPPGERAAALQKSLASNLAYLPMIAKGIFDKGPTATQAELAKAIIPETAKAFEEVIKTKEPVRETPAPTPAEATSESGITAPVTAGAEPLAKATVPREATVAKPAELVGMGGAVAAEFKPDPLKTAVKNAETDKNRTERGLDPILGPERQSNPEVWDRVMQKIDADAGWQDRLIAEVKDKPRALTPEETLGLDHRYVDLHNEYSKAVREGEQHMKDGYEPGIEEARQRAAHYEEKLNEVELVAKQVGTESGRSLAMRRQLIKEDFSLASMESRMRAAKGFKPLTPEEHATIKSLREKLDTAEKALGEAETKAGKRSAKAPLDTPTAKARAEVEGLRDKFNQELAQKRYELKSRLEKVWIGIKRTRGAIVNVVSSYDFSAPRQALVAILGNTTRLVTNPVRGAGMLARPFGQMFKAWASESGARIIEQKIKGRPNARSGADKLAGIEYTDLNSHSLTRFEENAHSIIDEWAALPLKTGKLGKTLATAPVKLASRGVRMSNRAFITFLNSTRAELFDELLRVNFKDRAPTETELRVIGNTVNIATGRGKLSPTTSKVASEVLWAPKLLASRVQFLTGQPLWGGGPLKGSGKARAIVAKEYARVLISGFLLSQVARLFDDKKEEEPTSSDFGKIVRGDTRIDVWGGHQQVTVLAARGASGATTDLKGHSKDIAAARKYGVRGMFYTTMDFLRAKLRPDVAAAVDIIDRKDFKGDPTTVGGVAQSLLVPLPLRDIVGIMQEHGFTEGMIIEALGQFGAGVSRYEDKEAQR